MARSKTVRTLAALALGTAAAAAKDPTATGAPADDSGAVLEISPADARPSVAGSAEHFTGTVAVDMLFQPNDTRNASAATVAFSPGARTAWHSHPAGQTLVVTSGTGWVQDRGRERRTMREGDVVWIPAEVTHWHGATDSTSMTHLAFQEQRDGRVVQWMDAVTDEHYLGPDGIGPAHLESRDGLEPHPRNGEESR